jgi:hypothetical protein
VLVELELKVVGLLGEMMVCVLVGGLVGLVVVLLDVPLLVLNTGLGEMIAALGSRGTTETTRISANGNPTLSTSVVVPGGLPRAIPVSVMPKSIQKDKNSNVEYNIYFIILIKCMQTRAKLDQYFDQHLDDQEPSRRLASS